MTYQLVREILPENPYELVDHIFKKIDGAYSEATMRAYRSDLNDYVDFCHRLNFPCFPTPVEAMVAFIEDCSARRLSVAFIKRKLTAITSFHRFCRLRSPVSDIDVQLAMRRLVREKGMAARQARGLSKRMFDDFIATTRRDIHGFRDRALLHLAYSTLCRRQELVDLLIEDLRFHPDGSGMVHQRAGKVDKLKRGRWIYLQPYVMKAVTEWLEVSMLKEGPILRGIKKNRKASPGRMCLTAVSRSYKRMARKAGYPEDVINEISSHSTRVGAAQELLESGASLLQVMHRGGWSLPQSVLRYVRNADTLYDYPLWRYEHYSLGRKNRDSEGQEAPLMQMPKIGLG